MMAFVTRIGRAQRLSLGEIGASALLFVQILARSGQSLLRFGLVRDQIFFMGNRSLSIIGVSGLFVGFVLALQGYYTLQRYGSAEAVGLLVALSLVRELGPVVTALAVHPEWWGAGVMVVGPDGAVTAGAVLEGERHGWLVDLRACWDRVMVAYPAPSEAALAV